MSTTVVAFQPNGNSKLVSVSTLDESTPAHGQVSAAVNEAKAVEQERSDLQRQLDGNRDNPSMFVAKPLVTEAGKRVNGSDLEPFLPPATMVYRANNGGPHRTYGININGVTPDATHGLSIPFRSACNIDLPLGDYTTPSGTMRRQLQREGSTNHGQTVPIRAIYSGIRWVRMWTFNRRRDMSFESPDFEDIPPGTAVQTNTNFLALRVRNRQGDLSLPAAVVADPHLNNVRGGQGMEPVFFGRVVREPGSNRYVFRKR